MNANAQPTAYIRRSVASRADPGDVSREFQTEEVRRLAGADGPTLTIIDRDWGQSAATDKTARRLAFLALLDAIEAGDVSALYAYSTDRLARSVEWSARLLNACRRAGVPIVTREGRIEPGDASAALLFNVLAAVNENALSGMEAKARATVARRQARNIAAGREPNAGMGRKNYGEDPSHPDEDVAAVLAAFDKAGSFLGTTKLLNAAHVPTRLGATDWDVRTVGRIIRRARTEMPHPPSECPNRPKTPGPARDGFTCPHAHPARQGARARSTRALSGLLRCGGTLEDGRTCGQIMSSTPRPGKRSVAWLCRIGHSNAGHSRPYVVSEAYIRPAAEAEAAHLRPRDPRTGGPLTEYAETERTAELEALEAERKNILEMARRGMVDMNEAERMVAEVKARSDALTAEARVIAIPQVIDWTRPARDVNTVLRALFDRIQLGPDLRPLPYPDGFAWTVPEWRG